MPASNISHELRTPINSVLGYGQILLRRRDFNADVKAKIKRILNSGEHLLEMINEVLEKARIRGISHHASAANSFGAVCN